MNSRTTNADNKDLYAALGLDRAKRTQITAKQIRDAYRALARQHHPDKMKAESDERMKKIAEANRILGDEQKRREYDYPFIAKLTFGVNQTITPEQDIALKTNYKNIKGARSILIKPLAAIGALIYLPLIILFSLLYTVAASLFLPLASIFSKKAEASLFAAQIAAGKSISFGSKIFSIFSDIVILPFVVIFALILNIIRIPTIFKLTNVNLASMLDFAVDKVVSAFTRTAKAASNVNPVAAQSYTGALTQLRIADTAFNVDPKLEQREAKKAAQKSRGGIFTRKPVNKDDAAAKTTAARQGMRKQ